MAQTGNEVGLSEAELNALPKEEQSTLCEQARVTLAAAGAHVVIDGVWELPAALDALQARVHAGMQP